MTAIFTQLTNTARSLEANILYRILPNRSRNIKRYATDSICTELRSDTTISKKKKSEERLNCRPYVTDGRTDGRLQVRRSLAASRGKKKLEKSRATLIRKAYNYFSSAVQFTLRSSGWNVRGLQQRYSSCQRIQQQMYEAWSYTGKWKDRETIGRHILHGRLSLRYSLAGNATTYANTCPNELQTHFLNTTEMHCSFS